MSHYNDPSIQLYRPNRLPRWQAAGDTAEEIEAQSMFDWVRNDKPNLWQSYQYLEDACDCLSKTVETEHSVLPSGVKRKRMVVTSHEAPEAVVAAIDAALDALFCVMRAGWDAIERTAPVATSGEFFSSSLD